ncbi:unnamed protein product, partial [Prorocentrum cordatum]
MLMGTQHIHIAAHRFDTLGGSMLTLMQFMTFDSVAPVYTPLIFAKPWLFIYFLVFLLLGPIALMNIMRGRRRNIWIMEHPSSGAKPYLKRRTSFMKSMTLSCEMAVFLLGVGP